MGDPRRIATVGDQPGQPIGDPETLLSQRQQHHAAVRGQATAVEGGVTFFRPTAGKPKERDRIVDHGDVAGCEVDGLGVSTQFLYNFNALSYARRLTFLMLMNKTG